jgi:hypothetical protein
VSNQNDRIKQLHKTLGNTVQELSDRLGGTRNVEEAEALLREIEEVNFRLMMVGRLLFSRTTASIDKQIDSLVAANAEVEKAIKEIEKIKDIISAVGKFLGKVDQVIGAIKLLAV